MHKIRKTVHFFLIIEHRICGQSKADLYLAVHFNLMLHASGFRPSTESSYLDRRNGEQRESFKSLIKRGQKIYLRLTPLNSGVSATPAIPFKILIYKDKKVVACAVCGEPVS